MKKSIQHLFFSIASILLLCYSCGLRLNVDQTDVDAKISNNELEKQAPIRVAEEVIRIYESPHPYASSTSQTSKIVWRDTIIEPNASFIAPHFSRLELQEGDFLIIRSPNGKRSWKYSSIGQLQREATNGFWGIHVYGEMLILEIESNSTSNGGFGYTIDKFSRGFGSGFENFDQEAICGADDSQNAICIQSLEPIVYNKSRAVARLLINGVSACTGWLIGEDGHLMTNNHCIENAQDALNTTVEFMAEGTNCSTNCQTWFACPGVIEANMTTLVQTDAALDYSLLSLPTNVSSTYGFLRLREAGAILEEQIYIPQHPAGWGKRIAMEVEEANGQTKPATITSLNRPKCSGTGNGDIGYVADTRGGSSGSPVIAYDDHLVIALHHCANCPNRGVPINEIIADLGNNLPNGSLHKAWSQIPAKIRDGLYTTHFPSDKIGFAAGEKGVLLKTEDGGDTWIMSNNGIPSSAYIYSIFFVNDKTGYAVGNFGNTFKTINGGTTWTAFKLTKANVRSVFFVNSQKGFIVTDGILYRTQNSGLSWQNITNLLPKGSNLLSSEIYFRNTNNGFILLQGAILRTTDGGNSWKKITIPALATYDIDFVSAKVGFICGIGTGLLKTTNGGITWTKINSFPSNTPQTVQFSDLKNGFVAGRAGELYLTKDGGTTWVTDDSTINQDIHKIVYLPSLDRYIGVAKGGKIIKK